MERVSCLINAGKYQSNLQRFSISVVLIFVLLWVAGCATLQKDFPRSESYALEPGPAGTLAAHIGRFLRVAAYRRPTLIWLSRRPERHRSCVIQPSK
jgi:hypothetical protein